MNILCLLGRHSAVPSEVRNQGFRFTQCRSCGCDMIGMRGAWKSVPKGFRVVWKGAGEPGAAAVPLRLIRNLPTLRPSPLHQRLERVARRVSEAVDLAGSAIRMAGWSLAGRYAALRGSLILALQPRQLVLPLPRPAR